MLWPLALQLRKLPAQIGVDRAVLALLPKVHERSLCTYPPPRRLCGDREIEVSIRVMKLTRATQWRPVAAIPLSFPTYHPQGMVKIGVSWFAKPVR